MDANEFRFDGCGVWKNSTLERTLGEAGGEACELVSDWESEEDDLSELELVVLCFRKVKRRASFLLKARDSVEDELSLGLSVDGMALTVGIPDNFVARSVCCIAKCV